MANNVLNIATGNSTLKNTGMVKQGLNPGVMKYLILVPKGTIIPTASCADAATFTTYVQGKLQANSRTLRWFRSPLLTNLEDKTEAPVMEKRDGFEKVVYEPTVNCQWLMNGAFEDFTNYKGFSLLQNFYDVFMIDVNNVFYGTQSSTGIKAFTMYQFYVMPWKQTMTTAAAKYLVQVNLTNNSQINEKLYFVDFSSSTVTGSDLDGLLDVALEQGRVTSTNTSSAIRVYGSVAGAGSLGKLFGDALSLTTVWKVATSGGTVRTLTAVAYSSTNDQYTISSSAEFATGDIVTLLPPQTILGIDPSLNLVTETGFAVTVS